MSRPFAHDRTWGFRLAGDALLYDETFELPYVFLQHVYSYIEYPPRGCVATHTISCIIARDGWDDGTGGMAYMGGGGVGHDHARITLKSRFGRGMSFRVQIYGILPYVNKRLLEAKLKCIENCT